MEIKMRLTPGERQLKDIHLNKQSMSTEPEYKPYQSQLPPERDTLKQAFQELNSLIGLTDVKKYIYEVKAFVEIQRKRVKEKLATEPTVLHAVFKGNPGTGKTTVARVLGKIFKDLGVLQKGHLIEVERADLVGEYIGHTAQKTREQIKKALGGILFIDEAYSLARGGEKDFGKEGIDVLVKAMEDYKDNLILILAGYKDEMNGFLRTNPGLRSRFPLHFDFPDYSIQELMDIAQLMLKEREYALTPDAQAALERILRKHQLFAHQHSGNARLVRNLVECSVRRQAVRLVPKTELTRADLMTIEPQDLLEAAKIVMDRHHEKDIYEIIRN